MINFTASTSSHVRGACNAAWGAVFANNTPANAVAATPPQPWESLDQHLWQRIADNLPLPAVLALSQTNKTLRGYVLGTPAAPLPVVLKKWRRHTLFYGQVKPPAADLSAQIKRVDVEGLDRWPDRDSEDNNFKCYGLKVHFTPDGARVLVHNQLINLRNPHKTCSNTGRFAGLLAVDWGRYTYSLAANATYFAGVHDGTWRLGPCMRYETLAFYPTDSACWPPEASYAPIPIPPTKRFKFALSPNNHQVACFLMVHSAGGICRILSLGGAQHGRQYGKDIPFAGVLPDEFRVTYDATGTFLLACQPLSLPDGFGDPVNDRPFYDFVIHVPSGTFVRPRYDNMPARRITFSADLSIYATLYQSGVSAPILQVGPLTLASLQSAEAATTLPASQAWLHALRSYHAKLAQLQRPWNFHDYTLLCLDAQGDRLAVSTYGLNVLIYHLRGTQPQAPQILQSADFNRDVFNDGTESYYPMLPRSLQFLEQYNALLLVSQRGDLLRWNLSRKNPKAECMWELHPSQCAAEVHFSPSGAHAVVMSHKRDGTQPRNKPTVALYDLSAETDATGSANNLPALFPKSTWYKQLQRQRRKLIVAVCGCIYTSSGALWRGLASLLRAWR